MNRKDFYKAVSDYKEGHLEHYGIAGQEWGKRRWQNKDGSLTPEGYEHYGYGKGKNARGHEGDESTVKSKAKKGIKTLTKGLGIATKKVSKGVNNVANKAEDWGRSKNDDDSGIKKGVKTLAKGVGVAADTVTDATGKAGEKAETWARGGNSKKPAFDDSTRLTGKEEEDAWKALAKYYESQQNSTRGGESTKPKSNDDGDNDKTVDDVFNNFTKDKWGKSASGKVKIGNKDVKLLVNGDYIKDTEKMKSNTKRAVNELSKSQKEMIDNIAKDLYKYEKEKGRDVSLSKIKKSFDLHSMYMSDEDGGDVTFWSTGSGIGYADEHDFTVDFWFDKNGNFVIDNTYSMDG